MTKKKRSSGSKYHVIAKVRKNGLIKHVKYNVSHLEKFALFLDKSFDEWFYFNVYDKQTKSMLNNFGQFTNNSVRPFASKIYN